jgi:hypothetical protein
MIVPVAPTEALLLPPERPFLIGHDAQGDGKRGQWDEHQPRDDF